jgi:hypothetical protein
MQSTLSPHSAHTQLTLGKLTVSKAFSAFDANHYEQACDQAIAMCDGNLRSTIKALIMANEYLEAELHERQAAVSTDDTPTLLKRSDNEAA